MNEEGKEGDVYKCDSLDQISGGMVFKRTHKVVIDKCAKEKKTRGLIPNRSGMYELGKLIFGNLEL